MTFTPKHTKYASYLGYITQAIINNLPPLLFVIFQKQFHISIEKIAMLISVNFGTQIIVDFLAAKFVDKIGYRTCIVAAHIFSVIGLVGIGLFPYLLPSAPFAGLLLAIIINAIGGGIIEVLISPIVEALPGDQKESAMSLLHSFYCWGHMGVVLLTTLFFQLFGLTNWMFLSVIWAIIPAANAIFFLFVPIYSLNDDSGETTPLRKLFMNKIFWILFLMMVCSGAAEQSMSQWSSYFAESGLGVGKTLGDLMGPCAFALLMGISRTIYGIYGSRLNLVLVMKFSAGLCVATYLLAALSQNQLIALIGCALCGFSVGIMWPGSFSLSAKAYPQGGTSMFAILALAGDLGCASGPWLVGSIAELSGNIKLGLLYAIVFPILLIICVSVLKSMRKRYSN